MVFNTIFKMKLTKAQLKEAQQIKDIINKDILSEEEIELVYSKYFPAYDNQISESGAFFTPLELAYDFANEPFGGGGVQPKEWKVIDLCAGIGILSYTLYNFHRKMPNITCVEKEPRFIEIGKKLLPNATWIEGDVTDENFIKSLGNNYDCVISNPPYGKIGGVCDWLDYKGAEFEYKVIEIGKHLSWQGVFLLPQNSAPFQLSGKPYYMDDRKPKKYEKFNKETGIELGAGIGFDTSIYMNDWKGTKIVTEICCVEY